MFIGTCCSKLNNKNTLFSSPLGAYATITVRNSLDFEILIWGNVYQSTRAVLSG